MATEFDEKTTCAAPHAVHTIGHSTRAIETFISMLQAHAVELITDVRRWPTSKRHPQFNREALADSLQENGIAYLWRGDLGGFRKPAPNSVTRRGRSAPSVPMLISC
jgi:uncharacterized protein (DUF488 family)